MSAREMQLKSLCLFVWLQSEIIRQNLYRQSGPPELLFKFALLLKSHRATCMIVEAVKGDCKVSTLLSEPKEGDIGVYL